MSHKLVLVYTYVVNKQRCFVLWYNLCGIDTHKVLFNLLYFVFLWRSTFVGYAWSFGFFIRATTVNDLRLRRIFYPRFYPLHLFSYLNYRERAILISSAKHGNYWYRFYNVFGMTRFFTGD